MNVAGAVEIYETAAYEKIASIKVNDVLYDMAYGKVPSGDKLYTAGYISEEDKGKIVVIDPVSQQMVYDIDMQGWPYYLEVEPKDVPKATVTVTAISTSTKTATPTFTATVTLTVTPTSTMTSTATPRPKKNHSGTHAHKDA